MSAREFNPGDVAVVEAEWVAGVKNSQAAVKRRDGWEALLTGSFARHGDVITARPLVVIDPEASDLYIQSDGRDMTVWDDRHFPAKALLTEHEAGPVLWAHLVATLPTRDDPQPEPTDPAVRVKSRGVLWARVGEVWICNGLSYAKTWEQLLEHPLTVIPPAPDAEPEARPFKVGDRVRVAERASAVGDRYRGSCGRVAQHVEPDSALIRFGDGKSQIVYRDDLTHADPA